MTTLLERLVILYTIEIKVTVINYIRKILL